MKNKFRKPIKETKQISKLFTSINEFKQHLNQKKIKSINERNWKHIIKIKHLIDSDILDDEQQVIEKCDKMINILTRYKNRFKDDAFYELEEIINNFEFLKHLHDGTIKEEEFDNYGFDGDATELFNDYLSQLYDFGDTYDVFFD